MTGRLAKLQVRDEVLDDVLHRVAPPVDRALRLRAGLCLRHLEEAFELGFAAEVLGDGA